MKRIRIYSLLLLLVCGASWAFAQRAEYWLDVDPGRGRGTAITVAGETVSAGISTAALSPGMHTLGIRTAVGNKWSLTYTHSFIILPNRGYSSLSGAEYWVDTDPGHSKATAVSVSAGTTQLSMPVNTAGLDPGIHTVGARLKQGNFWGLTYTHTFVILPSQGVTTLSGAEYWVDSDPGHGKATAVSVTADATQLSLPVNTASLNPGIHTVGARLKQGNSWGHTYTHTFVILPSQGVTTLSGAEYWVDADPGHGKATAVSVAAGTTQLSLPVNTTGLEPGIHTVGARLKQGNSWGLTYTHTFVILPTNNASTLSGAEYWVDNDPGHGKATAISVAADATQLSLPVNTSALQIGEHIVGIRLRQGNSWGHTYTHSFVILPNTAFEMTVQAIEGYWDYDYDHPMSIPFTQVGDSVIISHYPLPTNTLANGKHTLYLRAKADGKWGFMAEHEFCKTPQPLFEAFGDGDIICQNGNVYIEDLSENVDLSATTYAWDVNGDGTTDYTTKGGFTHTYTEPGNYTITLTLTTADGCEASYTQEVVVHSAANPTVALSLNNGVCVGSEVTLTATATNAGAAPVYEWLCNNRVIGTTDLPTFTYAQFADGDQVAVRLTADNPCALQPMVTSEATTMVIYALPQIELSVPAVIYTDAGVVQLTGMATPAGGQFFLDDATRQTTFIRANSVGVGEHTLRYVVASEHGCSAQAQTTFTVMERPKYTITFVDEDGTTVLQQSQVALDAMPTPPAEPTKAATEQYTYTFSGWSPAIVAATAAATYTATYTATLNRYTVIFANEDGSPISTVDYDYGAMPVAPEAPTKQNTAQYTYAFTGWTPAIATVTGNAMYTATFSQSLNRYTVIFANEDGSPISTVDYDYGAMPVAPEAPTKQNTAQYTYAFTGWTPAIATVTGNAMYTATFSQSLNRYTVIFANEDGSPISTVDYDYGAMPTPPDDPTKEADEQYTYEFSGWTPEIVAVVGDATYTATFEATPVEPIEPEQPITVKLDPQSAAPWNAVYLYSWTGAGATQPTGAWPGTPVTQDVDGWWAYTFDESIRSINIIWNSGSGYQTVDIVGVTASTCYSLNGTTGTQITVTEVDCSHVWTAIDQPSLAPQAQKVIEDDLLYIILPDGSKYSATGAKVQ